MIIKLTGARQNDYLKELYVESDNILVMYRVCDEPTDSTSIVLNGATYSVRETPAEIVRLVTKAQCRRRGTHRFNYP